jgi:aspartyl-tRNA(Asn)/glutamyl-tRNA(Gln) amidotransferase subunit C
VAVSPEEVRRIAELARLRLEPEEIDAMAAQLSSVLAHMEALAVVEAGEGRAGPEDGGEAAAGPDGGPPASVLRPDEPGTDPLSISPAELAPEFSDGLFTLPRVGFRSDSPSAADGEGDGAP